MLHHWQQGLLAPWEYISAYTPQSIILLPCIYAQLNYFFPSIILQALFFYGTDLKIGDLPIPRLSKHEWALLHEESPKNIYLLCHEDSLALFNHTSTYRRESDFPLTTLYLQNLDDLTSRKYYKTVAEKNKHLKDLALMNYIHSDCNAPSDRDHLVQMLQRHLTVDSYGACLHNRDLPKR